jgi:hypothetical protein
MPPRFQPGAVAYAKDGRRYTVEDVADGLVYCTSAAGAETEFPESQLMNAAEWSARTGGRRDMLYGRLKQAPAYARYKGPLERAGSEQLLAKAERVMPGILDFTAFSVACQIMTTTGDQDFVPELSIVRCREIFDAAAPETRATLLAGVIGAAPDMLVGASRLGDNLMRAMIEKGLESSAVSFDEFSGRRRQ